MAWNELLVPKREVERGFAVGLAIIAVAVLFFAAIVVLQFALNAASNASSVKFKQTALDAAEAGLNDGMRALDVSSGTTANGTTGTSTLANTSATYTWTMVKNNLSSSQGTTAGSIA